MRFKHLLALAALSTAIACGDTTSAGGAPEGGAPSAGRGGGGAASGGAPAAGGAGEGGGGAPGETFCEPGLPEVSFAMDVQPIFTTSCAKSTCHAGTQPDAGLDLREGVAHGELVDEMTSQCGGDRVRIVAGDPAESYLFDKVRGEELCGTSRRMPPTPNPMLAQGDLDILEAWICGGALDD